MEIPQDTVNMGLAACFPQVCLQDQEQIQANVQQSPGMGLVWWVFLFSESQREQALVGEWKHLDLQGQQPLRLVSGPLEADGSDQFPP